MLACNSGRDGVLKSLARGALMAGVEDSQPAQAQLDSPPANLEVNPWEINPNGVGGTPRDPSKPEVMLDPPESWGRGYEAAPEDPSAPFASSSLNQAPLWDPNPAAKNPGIIPGANLNAAFDGITFVPRGSLTNRPKGEGIPSIVSVSTPSR